MHILALFMAFDTVNQDLLFQNLGDVGEREIALKIFKSYATDRKQCVRINVTFSSTYLVTYAVSQRPVLGLRLIFKSR